MKLINYNYAIEIIPPQYTVKNKPIYQVNRRYWSLEFNKFMFVLIESFNSSNEAIKFINTRKH